jgi:hypothetical protein
MLDAFRLSGIVTGAIEDPQPVDLRSVTLKENDASVAEAPEAFDPPLFDTVLRIVPNQDNYRELAPGLSPGQIHNRIPVKGAQKTAFGLERLEHAVNRVGIVTDYYVRLSLFLETRHADEFTRLKGARCQKEAARNQHQ